MRNTMHKLAANWKPALAAVLLAGSAWTAWGITVNLNDGATSISCTTDGNTVIDPTGNITVPVLAGCLPTGDGGTTTPPDSFSLTVSNNGTGSGTVTCNGTSCASTYNAGTPVDLFAAPTGTSTFAGWSGDCSASGSSSTCSLTMDANHTVTATFNTSGGGDGGSDPGSGLWIDGSNFVHDRGALSELFVPRCVPDQYDNCRLGGNQSQYDTLVAGQVWAMRIPVGSGFAATSYPFRVKRAETEESLNAYDFAISTTPGDFNVSAECKRSGTGEIRVYDPQTFTPLPYLTLCSVTPNTMYYLNVRPQAGTAGATDCGSGSSNACRYRIQLPTGFPFQ